MKKWFVLFLFPISVVFGESELFLNVSLSEEEALDNIALDPFVACKSEDFGNQELTIFEIDDKDILLTFWSAEAVSKDFEDAFNFEHPFCSEFQPSPEHIPEGQSCLKKGCGSAALDQMDQKLP